MHSNPYLQGNFAPVATESSVTELRLTGQLPAGLSGTLCRVGPNPQFAPRDGDYHWFAGDGMLHAFDIRDGRVAYRNRWIRTPKWQLEHGAGQALFGTFGNPATSHPVTAGLCSGTANTNVLWHGGRLFALEEAHQPFELDPVTLASKGHQDFAGRLHAPFTAHPRTDPRSGALHFFAYAAEGAGTSTMLAGVLDPDCHLTRLESFSAPYASMVHDFMLTEHYALYPVMPLTASITRAMHGEPMYAWSPGKGTHVGVMRRDGAERGIRWFETGDCHAFHFMNAWEEGACIVVHAMQSERAPGWADEHGRMGDPARMVARLCRWRIDLRSGRIQRDYIDDLPAEFPRFDERYTGMPHRFGFYTCHVDALVRDPHHNLLFASLARLDLVSGERTLYTLPDGDVISEPVFAPAAVDAPEGQGWLLAVAWRARENRSDLLIFDAQDLAAGPVASAALARRVPFGFHGNWHADPRRSEQ
ncbi:MULTISPECIES: carotenoid oxygenase family protein [unclassified Janthinobacterium]|uniref:carotenoid oxygenase family protein n=1 Tax=unclassified Janthinobacterium TaxID=2610881 RepID=UPI0003450DD6|nr:MULTISPECIES: carotenoid oxygenase family protein [unclassified Janthinobacterium]MEC5160171.1 carotenoid cleavage dioxygenase-like enzyme [Janthinobacterium sp. CG_S6]